MTKLQIIKKLWSVVYDLKLYIKGHTNKTMDEIDRELDILEYECRKYADADDEEIML